MVGASTSAFGQTLMHRTIEEQGRSRMVHVGKIEVPAGGRLEFAPGGYHLMLVQPTRELSFGERIPMTLEFSGSQKLTAEFVVRGPAGK